MLTWIELELNSGFPFRRDGYAMTNQPLSPKCVLGSRLNLASGQGSLGEANEDWARWGFKQGDSPGVVSCADEVAKF